jgi:hypothetical protein
MQGQSLRSRPDQSSGWRSFLLVLARNSWVDVKATAQTSLTPGGGQGALPSGHSEIKSVQTGLEEYVDGHLLIVRPPLSGPAAPV